MGSGKARALAFRHTKRFLKVFVEDIEQAVRETPEEEEDGYEGDWDYRLSRGDLGGTSDPFVVDAFASSLGVEDLNSGRPSLLMDLIHRWFLLAANMLKEIVTKVIR